MQRQLKFKKEQILEKLKANKKQHALDYKEATEKYWVALVTRLNELLALATVKKGEKSDFYLALPAPKSYEDRYDTVIEMLSMTTDKEIELTEQEFRQLIMDEWDWKGDFAATIAHYGR